MAFTPLDIVLLVVVAVASCAVGFVLGCRRTRRALKPAPPVVSADDPAAPNAPVSASAGRAEHSAPELGLITTTGDDPPDPPADLPQAGRNGRPTARPEPTPPAANAPADVTLEDQAYVPCLSKSESPPEAQGAAPFAQSSGTAVEGAASAVEGMPGPQPVAPKRSRRAKAQPKGPSIRVTDVVSAAPIDDLRRIKGLGPRLEARLHALGITRFAQIAAWTAEDAARMGEALAAIGRPLRENWAGQARGLLASVVSSAEGEGELPLVESPAPASPQPSPQESGFLFPELAEAPQPTRRKRR